MNSNHKPLNGQKSLLPDVPTVRRCRRCGRLLKSPEGIARGIGRDCLRHERPPRRPRVLMHLADAGANELGNRIFRFRCSKCDAETDWVVCRPSLATRGVPCPFCNETRRKPKSSSRKE